MEYQSIWNLLDNTTNGSSKFRTRNWIKVIITGLNTSAQGEAQNNRNKKTIFKNCA